MAGQKENTVKGGYHTVKYGTVRYGTVQYRTDGKLLLRVDEASLDISATR